MIRTLTPVLATVLLVAACERQGVNPPTEPAAPITTPEVAPTTPAPPGVGPALPGAGPASFVGRWAGNAAWCANTVGAEQPITITPLRFEGYEHSCAITSLDQVTDGYELSLACQAEGEASRERVRLSRQEDVLRLTWLNRNDAVVLLAQCPTAPSPAVSSPAG
jgi:hypothetical protein